MSRKSSVNSSVVEELNEEAIDKHRNFRKIGTPKYGRLRKQRLSRIFGDPVEEAALRNPHHIGKSIREEIRHIQELKLLPICNQLSEMETVGILTVLESIVDMLFILGFTNEKLEVEPNISYMTLEERFGALHIGPNTLDIDKTESDPDSKQELFKKIQGERGAIEVTLERSMKDLIYTGYYKSLQEFVIHKMFVMYEEQQLEKQLEINEEAVADIMAQLSKHKYFMEAMNEDLDKKLADIKDKLYDVLVSNDIKERYIFKWEKARGQQHRYALVLQEKDLKKKVSEIKTGVDCEIHANQQILSFLSLDIEQLTYDVKTWSEKLFDDVEEIDLQTQKTKTQFEYVKKEVEEAEEILKERHLKIVQTLVRRILPLHCYVAHAKRTRAAIKIQKWWRNILNKHNIRNRKKMIKKLMKEQKLSYSIN